MSILVLGNCRREAGVHAGSFCFETIAANDARLRRQVSCRSRPPLGLQSPCASMETVVLHLHSASPPAPSRLPATSAIPIISLVDRDAGARALLLEGHWHSPVIVAYDVVGCPSIGLIATGTPEVIVFVVPINDSVEGLIYIS